jgi:3-isopropylmalate dehydrogenase
VEEKTAMHSMEDITGGTSSRQSWLHLAAPDASERRKLSSGCGGRPLGIVAGEGIGPEVMAAALHVLDAVESVHPIRLQRQTGGGDIGISNGSGNEGALSSSTAEFFREIFDDGGAVMCGPGGGRFVYDLRRHFDLFCKIAPIRPIGALAGATPFKTEVLSDLDILIVRDNAGGVYQGNWSTRHDPLQGEVAEHRFSYSESQVEQIVTVGAKLAHSRRGRMDVVIKDGGVPTISNLWRRTAERVASAQGVTCAFCNTDFAAYDLVRRPARFDVLVTPNLVGDILADLAAAFLGSRGLSYSANFSACGRAVYQTGHGAAHDLAGTDRANPVGQILAMAMMLRESYGLQDAAHLIEQAIEDTYRSGHRTDDIAEAGCRRVGTRQMGELISQAVIDARRVSVPV